MRILIPLDGSDTAEGVLPVVEKMLLREGTTAVLLRVVHFFPSLHSAEYATVREMLLQVCDRYLRDVARGLERKGIVAETRVVEGDPAEAILAEPCDLVALSTHGRTGIRRFLLGSVAEKVIRHSKRPVLAVRGAPRPSAPKPFRQLLVPVDGSARSESMIPMAVEWAKTYGSKLTLLRVIEPPEHEVPASLARRWEEQAGEELARAAERVKNAGVDGVAYLRTGPAAAEILKFAQENPIDLVCMATHGRGGISRWILGSVAERVLRHADVPILLARGVDHA